MKHLTLTPKIFSEFKKKYNMILNLMSFFGFDELIGVTELVHFIFRNDLWILVETTGNFIDVEA